MLVHIGYLLVVVKHLQQEAFSAIMVIHLVVVPEFKRVVLLIQVPWQHLELKIVPVVIDLSIAKHHHRTTLLYLLVLL
jgi:hypothetical protein